LILNGAAKGGKNGSPPTYPAKKKERCFGKAGEYPHPKTGKTPVKKKTPWSKYTKKKLSERKGKISKTKKNVKRRMEKSEGPDTRPWW